MQALLMDFLSALSISKRSKHILIHSLADTKEAPLSAILPIRSSRFSWTFGCLFLSIGVNLGRRALIGGVILDIPTVITIALRAWRILANTSGYSSPRYSLRTTPILFRR